MERKRMNKYDFHMCMDLRDKLKEKIKGDIFVTKDRDILSINIRATKGISYRRQISEVNRYTNIDNLAEAFELDYRQFLISIFFI